MEDDGVHVPVLIWVLHWAKCLATVLRLLDRGAHKIESIKLVGARKNFLIVVRAGAATHGVSAFDPATAPVV